MKEKDAMTASRDIMAAEKSGKLRAYPAVVVEERELKPFEGITSDFTMDGRGVITIIPSAPSTLVTGGLLAELRGILVMLRDAVGHPDNAAVGDRGLALIDAALATQPAESKACASVGVEPPNIEQVVQDFAAWARPMLDQSHIAHWVQKFRAALASPAPSVGEPVAAFRALLRAEVDATIDVSGDIARQEAQIDEADHLLVKFDELFPIATPPAAQAATERPVALHVSDPVRQYGHWTISANYGSEEDAKKAEDWLIGMASAPAATEAPSDCSICRGDADLCDVHDCGGMHRSATPAPAVGASPGLRIWRCSAPRGSTVYVDSEDAAKARIEINWNVRELTPAEILKFFGFSVNGAREVTLPDTRR